MIFRLRPNSVQRPFRVHSAFAVRSCQRRLILLVPGERFELPTNGLQNRCSTTELTRQNPILWQGHSRQIGGSCHFATLLLAVCLGPLAPSRQQWRRSVNLHIHVATRFKGRANIEAPLVGLRPRSSIRRWGGVVSWRNFPIPIMRRRVSVVSVGRFAASRFFRPYQARSVRAARPAPCRLPRILTKF